MMFPQLDAIELKSALRMLGVRLGSAELQLLLTHLDANGDGKVGCLVAVSVVG